MVMVCGKDNPSPAKIFCNPLATEQRIWLHYLLNAFLGVAMDLKLTVVFKPWTHHLVWSGFVAAFHVSLGLAHAIPQSVTFRLAPLVLPSVNLSIFR